jgi:hypothetical protein
MGSKFTLSLILLCCCCLWVPAGAVLGSREHFLVGQWIAVDGTRSDVVDDCVIVDAHEGDSVVRIVVVGACRYKRRLMCYFDDWTNPTAARVYKEAPDVSVLACDVPTASVDAGGQVRLTLDNAARDTWANNIEWRRAQAQPPRDLVVCSRLHALHATWSAQRTTLLGEWLELHAQEGTLVHLYVHAVEPDEILALLDAYRRRGVAVLHDWNTLTHAALSADCLMRYETRARYVAFYDVDEFVTVPHGGGFGSRPHQILDDRFAANGDRPAVQLVHSMRVRPILCDVACEHVPLIARFCHPWVEAGVHHTKWFVLNDHRRRSLHLLPPDAETVPAEDLLIIQPHQRKQRPTQQQPALPDVETLPIPFTCELMAKISLETSRQ